MISEDHLAELRVVSPDAQVMREGDVTYIYLPVLKLPAGCSPPEVEGLLRPGPGPDGYTTRLFLSAAFPHKGQNWTEHRILDKTWHTYSFNNVPANLRPMEILANHLSVLR
jgi:hypothetical protein